MALEATLGLTIIGGELSMKRFLLLTIVAATIAACSHAAADKREAMNERCLWMSSQAGIFAQARDKGSTRQATLDTIAIAQANEPEESRQNREKMGLPDQSSDMREIVRQVYDVVPSLPPDQVATKVSNDCRAQIAQ